MAKILTIGKYYPPFQGGIEAYTQDICEALSHHHNVEAVVFNHLRVRAAETLNGVMVRRCKRLALWKGQPISIDIIWSFSLKDVDLIHFHAPNFVAAAVLLIKMALTRRRVPLVITHHMDVFGRKILRKLAIPIYHALIRRAVAIVVTSSKNAAVSADFPAGTSTVAIPLGIEPDRYQLSDEGRREAVVWMRELAGGNPTVAFIGRHARYKGLDVLIKATAQIETLHAVIAGDGPYRSAAAQLADSLGISSRVHFLGIVSAEQKRQLLGACDVFAFPSTEITEAFGISMIEAMAAGAPVVASELPTGVSDIAINEDTALTVRPGDADALAAGIARVLADPILAETLRGRARAHVYSHFTKSAMVERTCSLIDKLIEDHEPDGLASPERRRNFSPGVTGALVDR